MPDAEHCRKNKGHDKADPGEDEPRGYGGQHSFDHELHHRHELHLYVGDHDAGLVALDQNHHRISIERLTAVWTKRCIRADVVIAIRAGLEWHSSPIRFSLFLI